MKIITKKAYRFTLYDGLERMETVEVEPFVIKPVPAWVEKDPLFGLALKAGNVSVIGSAGNASLDAVDAVMTEAKQLGIKNPGNMTLDQLQQAIANIKQGGDITGGAAGAKPSAKAELVAEASALGVKNANKLTVQQLQEAIVEAKKELQPLNDDDKTLDEGASSENSPGDEEKAE